MSLASLAVRVDDGVGLVGTFSTHAFSGGLVFGLVDVSWLWFIGFASADRSDFPESCGFPDSVPALRDGDVVGHSCGDWVISGATVGTERGLGAIAADIGRIAGCGEHSRISGGCASACSIISSRDWAGSCLRRGGGRARCAGCGSTARVGSAVGFAEEGHACTFLTPLA